MNQLLKSILIMVAGITLLTACSKDFLNTKPLSQIQASDTWKDGGLSEAFVTDIYNGLGNGGFNDQHLSSFSVKAVFFHPGRVINPFMDGTLGPTNFDWVPNTSEG